MNNFLEDMKQEISQYYDELVAITPKLLLAILLLLVSWFFARQLRRFADRRLKKRIQDPLLAEFLATLTRAIILILGFLVALRVLGFSGVTASILAGAGISAFVIGFALRDIGENFLAGILLAFKRPFRVGDFVESGSISGTVLSLNIRDTQLKTLDGKDVYVPNSQIIKNPLINFTIDGFLRFDFIVTLPARSDYQTQLLLIEDTVNQVDGVLKERRKTSVNISGILPYRVDVTVNYWIDTFSVNRSSESIRSEVMLRVQEVLEKFQEQLP